MLDKTIKEAYLKYIALPHIHNLYSTIAEELLKYTHSTEIRQPNAGYTVPLVPPTTRIFHVNYTTASNRSFFSLVFIFTYRKY